MHRTQHSTPGETHTHTHTHTYSDSHKTQQHSSNLSPSVSWQSKKHVMLSLTPRLTALLCLSLSICRCASPCWSVCLRLCEFFFQGGLGGEVEFGQRLSDKRRLQERRGHTHPAETDGGRGSPGNGGGVCVVVGGAIIVNPLCCLWCGMKEISLFKLSPKS